MEIQCCPEQFIAIYCLHDKQSQQQLLIYDGSRDHRRAMTNHHCRQYCFKSNVNLFITRKQKRVSGWFQFGSGVQHFARFGKTSYQIRSQSERHFPLKVVRRYTRCHLYFLWSTAAVVLSNNARQYVHFVRLKIEHLNWTFYLEACMCSINQRVPGVFHATMSCCILIIIRVWAQSYDAKYTSQPT